MKTITLMPLLVTWTLGYKVIRPLASASWRVIHTSRILCAPNGNKGDKVKVAKVNKDGGKVAGPGAEEIRQARLDKIDTMRAANVNPFAYTFAQTHKTATLQEAYKSLADGVEDTEAEVAVAGRIMVANRYTYVCMPLYMLIFVME
jgi:hypothetical protein